MENLYSCRKCVLFCLCVLFVILSTEAGSEMSIYSGPEVIDAGDSFRIECRVSEFEPIKWRVDGAVVEGEGVKSWWRLEGPGAVRAVLEVPLACPDNHTGEYRCSPLVGPGHRLTVRHLRAVSKPQINYDFDNYKTFKYRVALELQCNVTLTGDEKEAKFSWTKGGAVWKAVPGESEQVDTATTSTLKVSHALDKDAGNYSCIAKGSTTETASVSVVLEPFIHLPDYTNVVEGEKLIINCIVHGFPVPELHWIIDNNKTYTKSEEEVKILEFKEKEKGTLPNSVPNGILQIDEALMKHRSTYTCYGEVTIGNKHFNSSASTYVRVKDKMAALWPFLGICTEVVVLCAVILIYEKKRNKTEMDESDTDGSPDQKNTPDHGKDSDVRHRK